MLLCFSSGEVQAGVIGSSRGFMQCLGLVQGLFSAPSPCLFGMPCCIPGFSPKPAVWSMAVHMAPRCGLPSCFGKLQKLSHAPSLTDFKRLERLLCWVVCVCVGAVGICNANGEICWSHQSSVSLILHLSFSFTPPKILLVFYSDLSSSHLSLLLQILFGGLCF